MKRLRCGHCGHSNDGHGHGFDNAGNKYDTKVVYVGNRCPYCHFGILVKGGKR